MTSGCVLSDQVGSVLYDVVFNNLASPYFWYLCNPELFNDLDTLYFCTYLEDQITENSIGSSLLETSFCLPFLIFLIKLVNSLNCV